MAKRSDDTGLDALSLHGGILPAALVEQVRALNAGGQSPADYGIPKGLRLREEIARYWRIAGARWDDFREQTARADVDAATATLTHWLEPLLREVFGYAELTAVATRTVAGRSFPITHTALGGRVPLVLVPDGVDLDERLPRFGQDGRRRSAMGLLQETLNADDDALWGLASDGRTLRLLRDNPSMTRPAYLELDLERMFGEDLYADFLGAWLLLHASRLAAPAGSPGDCHLERWRLAAEDTGERALAKLRDGVTEALRLLGTGFVAEPANAALRARIAAGELTADGYFQQLLRLVYRLLFLFTAEDRDLLHAPEAGDDARTLYARGYGTGPLRERAARRRYADAHGDLWQGLLVTCRALAAGEPALGLPALGGLYAPDQCPDLDTARLPNRALLGAVRALAFFTSGPRVVRINFRDMDTEELGSVYESLLELVPRLQVIDPPWRFGFAGLDDGDAARGHSRKLTGSYYTPDTLVLELIRTALLPVIERTLDAHPDRPREALLALRIVDPAAGSGHFLLAAARRLAAEVARLDAGGDQPTAAQYRHALREVVAHCVHGVDLNPLAVELCRTALWLEALEPGRPLGFLDARIRCGNALVGVLDPAAMEAGIPDAAYEALSGDDADTCRQLRRTNAERVADLFGTGAAPVELPTLADVEAMPEDTLAEVEAKRAAFAAREAAQAVLRERLVEDLWTGAFFLPKRPQTYDQVPLGTDLDTARGGADVRAPVRDAIAAVTLAQRFFHWRLAFPDVFADGGFDVVLGNPPWERIKLQEQEFFAVRHPAIAAARTAAERGRMIDALRTSGDPAQRALHSAFLSARRAAEAESAFVRASGRFPLTAHGDVNLYALFAELALALVGAHGRAGIVVPTGIATDDSTKRYFDAIATGARLVSLHDLENRTGLFPGVHRSYKFCLLTLGNDVPAARFVCFATATDQLRDVRRQFELSGADVRLLNPNTRTCPVFRSQADAELTKKIYRRAPVLIDETDPDRGNPWGIRFATLFHMSIDSHLFVTADALSTDGWERDGPDWIAPGRDRQVRLYEAKMIHQFDHRWATYAGGEARDEGVRDATLAEKAAPDWTTTPRYWVPEWQVTRRITRLPREIFDALERARAGDPEGATAALAQAFALWLAGWHLAAEPRANLRAEARRCRHEALADALARVGTAAQMKRAAAMEAECGLTAAEADDLMATADLVGFAEALLLPRRRRWLLGWRDITNATNERTVIASVVPAVGVGNNLPLLYPSADLAPATSCCLLANLCSLTFDFVARHKVGGTHMNFFIIKQLPVLAPNAYDKEAAAFVAPRVLELTYTAHDLRPWAEDLGYAGPPFAFDPGRRAQLRAELDAWFARAYGLTRDELRYVLDPADVYGADYPSETFRVLKTNEQREFGEYRTRRLVLDAFDALP